MNAPQLCPDDLLLAARAGQLSLQDDARLSFHLARCSRCQAALQVGAAFDAVLGARPGDDAIASRIAQSVVKQPQPRRFRFALAALILLCSSAAGAAVAPRLWQAWISARSDVSVAAPGSVVSGAVPGAGRSATASNSERDLEAPPEILEAPAATAVASAAPSVAHRSPVAPSANTARSAALAGTELTAAQLFAEANALRNQGESSAARARYLELQRRFVGSVEAQVSHVSLGRLELASEPAAALRRFDAYLKQRAHTTLSEEALYGRASALMRLGRGKDEQATWRRLLESYPASVYAERARARLAAAP